MNVLLILPHSSQEENEARYVSPALGIHRLAGALRQHGHTVEAFDPNLTDVCGGQALTDTFLSRPWNIIGFSVLEETLMQDCVDKIKRSL